MKFKKQKGFKKKDKDQIKYMNKSKKKMLIGIELIERKSGQLEKKTQSKGKVLIKDVVNTLSNVSWQNVANTSAIPVFLTPFTKIVTRILKESTKITRNDILKFTHFSTNLWNYIEKIDPNRTKVYTKLKAETSALTQLWDKYDTSSSVVVKWLAKAMTKILKTLFDLQRTAMMNMGYITGSILQEWFLYGEVFATEAILYSFIAMLELTISTPSFKSDYMRSVGVELFHYLDKIPNEKYNIVKTVSLGDFGGSHKEAIRWVANTMKSLSAVVLIGLHNIMLRCTETLNFIMSYITQIFESEFLQNKHDLSIPELKKIATGLIQNDLVSEDRKNKLRFAIKQVERVDKYVPKPGVVSPHLVALLLRQLYYGEEPDMCVGKDILKQRFGETAENVVSGVMESYELLRLEVELAFVTKDRDVPNSVEGGFGDWCGKKKDKTNDELNNDNNIQETPEERDNRLRQERFQRKASERRLYELTIDQRSLEEHRTRLEDERTAKKIEKDREELRVINDIKDINNSNLAVNREVYRVQLVDYKPGKNTVALKEAGDAARGFGTDALITVSQKLITLGEEIEQIEWELLYIESRVAQNRNILTQSEKRWTRNILMVSGVGVLIYFAWQYFSGIAQVSITSWETLANVASKYSSNSVFYLLKTQYEEYQKNTGLVLPAVASVMDLQNTANRLLHELNTYIPTDIIGFRNFIEKYGQTMQGIMLEASDGNLKILATQANENIYSVMEVVGGEAVINAQKLAVKSVQQVLSISIEGLMKGHLPSNLSNLVSALSSVKGTAIDMLASLWSAFKPSPSTYTSFTGLLQLSATRASGGFVDSVGKQLTSQYTTVFGVFIMYIIMVAGFARIFAIIGSDQYDTMIESGRVFTGTMIASATIFEVIIKRIGEATAANATVYWETLQSLVGPLALAAAIAGYFSPWGWLTSGFSRASTAYGNWIERRGIQQQQQTPLLPAPQPQQQSNTLTSAPSDRRSIQINLTEKESNKLAMSIGNRNYDQIVPTKKESDEDSSSDDEDSSSDVDSGLAMLKSCIVCAEKAFYMCSHCKIKGYCNEICASLDWSKRQNKHVSF